MCNAAAGATSSVAEEISAAVSKLTGEAQTNGEVYVSAVKKAAAKVSRVSKIRLVCAGFCSCCKGLWRSTVLAAQSSCNCHNLASCVLFVLGGRLCMQCSMLSNTCKQTLHSKRCTWLSRSSQPAAMACMSIALVSFYVPSCSSARLM